MLKSALICISNFGDAQIAYLAEVVETFKSIRSMKADIIIHSTVPVGIEGVDVRIRPSSIGQGLTFEHRSEMVANASKYDLFLYTENDVVVTEHNILAWLDEQRRLPEGFITGFVRYEEKGGRRLLLDAHPKWRVVDYALMEIGGRQWFGLANMHSGCFVLTAQLLRTVIESGGFVIEPHRFPYGVLEQGASDPYTQCGLRHKLLPLEFEPLLVHHLPNKYVNLGGVWENPGPYTVDGLQSVLRNGAGRKISPDRVPPRRRLSPAARSVKRAINAVDASLLAYLRQRRLQARR